MGIKMRDEWGISGTDLAISWVQEGQPLRSMGVALVEDESGFVTSHWETQAHPPKT